MVYDDTGLPVKNVEVCAEPKSFPNQRPGHLLISKDVTDENGIFHIKGLPEAAYSVFVNTNSENLLINTRLPDWVTTVVPMVDITPGRTVSDINPKLTKGAIVKGRVLFPEPTNETPFATVQAMHPVPDNNGFSINDNSIYLTSTRTDNTGNYQIRLPKGETKLYLSSISHGFINPNRSQNVVIPEGQGEIDGVDFNLEAGPQYQRPEGK